MRIFARTMTTAATIAGIALLSGCIGQTPDPVKSVEPVLSQQTNIIMRLQGGEAEPQSFELDCTGGAPSGTHPNPQGACDVLLSADFTLFSVGTEEECTEIYGGDSTMLMIGHIKGKAISTEFSRVNGCEISRWDSLVPLLPQANDEIVEYQAPGSEN